MPQFDTAVVARPHLARRAPLHRRRSEAGRSGARTIGVVLADRYAAIAGLGYLIVRSASTFQFDKMFVLIVTLAELGATQTPCVHFAEARALRWTQAGNRA